MTNYFNPIYSKCRLAAFVFLIFVVSTVKTMVGQSKFNSLIGFLIHFSEEKKSLEHLEDPRWPDSNDVYPICKHETVYWFDDCKRFKHVSCIKQFTTKVEPIFESSNMLLNIWCAATLLATSHKKCINSLQLAKDLSIIQKSSRHLLCRIRELVSAKAHDMIVSKDDVYEVGEHYQGGKKKNKHSNKHVPNSQGRSTKIKTPIFGIVKRGGDITKLQLVKDTKASTLWPIITQNIPFEPKVYSDEWVAYRGLNRVYEHEIVKHSSGEYVLGNAHTNRIESFLACFTHSEVGIYHHISDKHPERYCGETAFTYNNRKAKESQRFELASTHRNGRRVKWDNLVVEFGNFSTKLTHSDYV